MKEVNITHSYRYFYDGVKFDPRWPFKGGLLGVKRSLRICESYKNSVYSMNQQKKSGPHGYNKRKILTVAFYTGARCIHCLRFGRTSNWNTCVSACSKCNICFYWLLIEIATKIRGERLQEKPTWVRAESLVHFGFAVIKDSYIEINILTLGKRVDNTYWNKPNSCSSHKLYCVSFIIVYWNNTIKYLLN